MMLATSNHNQHWSTRRGSGGGSCMGGRSASADTGHNSQSVESKAADTRLGTVATGLSRLFIPRHSQSLTVGGRSRRGGCADQGGARQIGVGVALRGLISPTIRNTHRTLSRGWAVTPLDILAIRTRSYAGLSPEQIAAILEGGGR